MIKNVILFYFIFNIILNKNMAFCVGYRYTHKKLLLFISLYYSEILVYTRRLDSEFYDNIANFAIEYSKI
jgi:hypothetical protein